MGDPSVVGEICASHKVKVNLRDSDGYTALHIAAQHGHEDVVKRLLDIPDIEADAVAKDGVTTPLVLARLKKHNRVASLLQGHTNSHRNH
jgi:ankyrin repeat protein